METETCTTVETVHTTCRVRPSVDPTTGWCPAHQVPVYRAGLNWFTDSDQVGVPVVLDESTRRRMPTGRVTVTCPAGWSDRELAGAAGFGPEHFGFDVTRYEDGTALVSLWND